MASSPTSATALLASASDGSKNAVEQLVPLIYDELRAIASAQLKHERIGHTLQTTALVNEAYLRLIQQRETDWKNRTHFFAIAARVTRRVLIDHARAQIAGKRGGRAHRVTLADNLSALETNQIDILDLHAALSRLEALDKIQAQIVELRFFCSLTIEDCAEIIGISPRKINDEWRMARAWLGRELSGDETP